MKKLSVLSPEEQQTIAAYASMAAARRHAINGTPFNLEIWRPEFEKFKKLLPSGMVIDIGCGNGRDSRLFNEKHAYTYVGIDLSPEMLNEARDLFPSAMFMLMNMYTLEFPDRIFDGFWAPASYLHVPKRKIRYALREVRRVVKSGGIGFICVKEGEGEKMIPGAAEGQDRFYALYQEGEFLKVLQANHFEVLEHARDLREYDPPKCNVVWLMYLVRVQ